MNFVTEFLRRLLHRGLNRERFVKRILRAFRDAGADNVQYNESEFSISFGTGTGRAFLSNIFANCRDADEESRGVAIDHFVSSSLNTPSIPNDFESARQHLMPVIRGPAYNSLNRLHLSLLDMDTSELGWICQPLAPGLAVGLAYDTRHALTMVNESSFNQWGEELGRVLNIAIDNLRNATRPDGFVEQQPGVFVSCWNDSYDTSRILLTDYVYRLSVEGNPVAFLPNRHRLWITGDRDIAGLRYVLTVGQESHILEGHPLSPELYVLADGKWTDYVPDEPILCELCLSIRRDSEAWDYHQQKTDLEELHKKRKLDIFVASFQVFETQSDKSRFSQCVWSKGVDSLLPKTDRIAIVVDDQCKDIICIGWNQAIAVVHELMEQDPELLPVRYRVKTFPTQTQIARLRQLEKEPNVNG